MAETGRFLVALGQLVNDVKGRQNAVSNLQWTVKKLHDENVDLQTKLQNSETEWTSKLQEVEKRLIESQKSYQLQIASLRAAERKQLLPSVVGQKEIAGLKDEIIQLQKNKHALEQQLEDTQTKFRESEERVIHFNRELANAFEMLNELNEKLKKQEAEIDELLREIESQNGWSDKMRIEFKRCESELEQLKEQLFKKDAEITNLKAISVAIPKDFKDFGATINDRARLKEMELKYAMYQPHLDELKRRISALKEENIETLRLLQQTQESAKVDKGKVRSLTESLEISRNQLEDSKVALQNAFNDKAAVEKRNNSLEHQIGELKEEFERMKAQLEFAKRESDASNSKITFMEKEGIAAVHRFKNIVSERAAMQHQITSLSAQLTVAIKRIAELEGGSKTPKQMLPASSAIPVSTPTASNKQLMADNGTESEGLSGTQPFECIQELQSHSNGANKLTSTNQPVVDCSEAL